MKLTVKQLKQIIKEEVQEVPRLGVGGPRVGSTIMTIKSGDGPVMFKVMGINEADQTATLESDRYGVETVAVPFKDWKSFNTDQGQTIYFNAKDACWH